MISQEERQVDLTPKKTWFFERGDGEVLAMEEKEAWNLLNQRSNWARKDFKMVGCSDGTTYAKMVRQSKEIKEETSKKLAEAHQDLKQYLSVLEKLKFEDVLDDEHEKVQRVKKQIKKSEALVDELSAQVKNINKTIIDQAFQAELEVAKQNQEMPRNFDIITPDANDHQRGKIINNLAV